MKGSASETGKGLANRPDYDDDQELTIGYGKSLVVLTRAILLEQDGWKPVWNGFIRMGGKKLGKAQLEEFGYKECGTKNVYNSGKM